MYNVLCAPLTVIFLVVVYWTFGRYSILLSDLSALVVETAVAVVLSDCD